MTFLRNRASPPLSLFPLFPLFFSLDRPFSASSSSFPPSRVPPTASPLLPRAPARRSTSPPPPPFPPPPPTLTRIRQDNQSAAVPTDRSRPPQRGLPRLELPPPPPPSQYERE